MGINLLTFNQKTVTPKDDALIQQFALGQDGFFYGGVVTYTGGNTLHFASGEGVICGREFVLEDTDVSAALPASGTLLGQVYIHIDLSNADTPIELICETAAELTELTKDENMNVDNGEYDLQLCTFTATTSAITDLSSKVTYIKKGGAGSNDNLATVEEGSTSSQAYVIGQHLVYDDIYCEVIETIAENDAFVVYPNAGANIKPAKVGEEIYSLSQNLTLNYALSNLPQDTDINTFLQMVLEKLYPARNYVFDGDWKYTTNASTPTQNQCSNVGGFTVSDNMVFMTPPSTALTCKGTRVNSIQNNGKKIYIEGLANGVVQNYELDATSFSSCNMYLASMKAQGGSIASWIALTDSATVKTNYNSIADFPISTYVSPSGYNITAIYIGE